jgi:hypothetical protein|tara:strand:+ start:294 stop:635 length:342 start_codon:yes stop_codon:yes gene_type:complete
MKNDTPHQTGTDQMSKFDFVHNSISTTSETFAARALDTLTQADYLLDADPRAYRKHRKTWVRIAAQDAVASGVLSFHENVARGGPSAPLDCALDVIFALEAAGLRVTRDRTKR